MREKRAQQAEERRKIQQASRIIKQSGNAIAVKTTAEEPGKYEIEFQNRNGGVSQAF